MYRMSSCCEKKVSRRKIAVFLRREFLFCHVYERALMIKVKGSLYKLQIDSEGEATIVLKIPLADAQNTKLIPTQELLEISIGWKERK